MQIRNALLNGPLGFGGAPLGNMFHNISDEEGDTTVDTAWDLGTRYFDTAPFYGAGLSEIRLGRVLAKQRTGGTYRFVFSHAASEQPMAFFGRYIEVTPHSRIVLTNEESADGAVSTVTFEERATRRYWSCTNSIPQSKPSTTQSPLEAQAGQASRSSSWTPFSSPW